MLEGSIAGIAGIDVLEFDQPRRDQPHHRPLPPRRRSGRGRQRRARPRQPRAPPPARTRCDEPTIAKVEADAQAIMILVFTSAEMTPLRDHRLCRPLRRRPAEEPQRRRRRDDLRRAPLCHAHLDRPRAAGGLQSHGPGRRERAAGAERRAAVGAHREPRPRVHACCRARGSSRPSSSATSSSRSPTTIR